MLGSDAVALIQQRLGWRSDKSTEILAALNEAQDAFETGSSLPWWLKEEDATLTTVADQAYLSLPTGYIRTVPDEQPHFISAVSGEAQFLIATDYDRARLLYAGEDAAAPVAYVIRESRIYFYPTPDDAYSLTWSYYKKADDITLLTDAGWMLNIPYLLIGKAGMEMADDLGNDRAAKRFGRMLAEWNTRFLADIVEREASGRIYYMGGRK